MTEMPEFLNTPEEPLELDPEVVALHEEVLRRIAEAQTDPRTQSYFMRMDTKTVIQSEKEYERCQKLEIPITVIRYNRAVQLVKEEEARKKKRLKAKKAKKVARASRKRNR